MRTCRIVSGFLVVLLFGGLRAAGAQPSLVEHRYMVSEHTSVNQIAAFLTTPFQKVEIRSVEIPEKVIAGELTVFAVSANVGTATLPITAEWTFPDGETKRGLSVTHTLESPGTYEVTVRVENPKSFQEKAVTVNVVSRGVVKAP